MKARDERIKNVSLFFKGMNQLKIMILFLKKIRLSIRIKVTLLLKDSFPEKKNVIF